MLQWTGLLGASWSEHPEFELLDRLEVLRIACAQGKVVFNSRDRNQSITCTNMVRKGVFLDVYSSPVTDVLREREGREAKVLQKIKRFLVLGLVADALQQFHVGLNREIALDLMLYQPRGFDVSALDPYEDVRVKDHRISPPEDDPCALPQKSHPTTY